MYFITIISDLQEMESVSNVESIVRLNDVAKAHLAFPRQKIIIVFYVINPGVLRLSFLDPLLLSS